MNDQIVDQGVLTTRRTAATIGEWFAANGGYDHRHEPSNWKIRAQQKLWRTGLVGDAAGLQWAAVIDEIASIVEEYAQSSRADQAE